MHLRSPSVADKNATSSLTEVTVSLGGRTACTLELNGGTQCIFNTTSGAYIDVEFAPSNASNVCKDYKVEKGTCALGEL